MHGLSWLVVEESCHYEPSRVLPHVQLYSFSQCSGYVIPSACWLSTNQFADLSHHLKQNHSA